MTCSSGPYSWRMNTQPSSAPTASMPSSMPSRPRCGSQARVEPERDLRHRAGGCDVAAAQARSLDHLDVGIGAVPLLDRGDALVGAAEPAGQVVADAEPGLCRRIGAEVRVEGNQP